MNDELKQQTINTYNQSAKQLAEYFRGIGSRVDDIKKAFELSGLPKHPRVLEIGCGDGRDAKEIVQKAEWYLGFDISSELIKLAKALVPKAEFKVADAVNFNYPKNIDVVFAFASLLHVNKNDLSIVFDNVYDSLKPGGIFYLSLKYAPNYEERIKADKFGTRLFFFYNPKIIEKLASDKFEVAFHSTATKGKTDWFDIALKKV